MKFRLNHISILFIVCFLCFLVAGPAWSTIYYVDAVSGRDSNPGTSADDAWKTLHYAVTKLGDGDVLNVAAGTYRLIDAVTNPGGEADAPLTLSQGGITIQGTAGAVLDGESNCSSWDSAFEINASNVTIKDLKITNFTCDAVGENILVIGGSNNRIESCDISNSGIGIKFSYSSDGGNNIVENCLIHNHINRGIEIVRDSTHILRNQIYENGTNIYISEDSGQTIRPVIANNLIYAMNALPGRGIEIYAPPGSAVAGQVFHNTLVSAGQSLSRGVYVDEESLGEKVTVQYNIITGFETGIEDGFPIAGALEVNYNNIINNATDYSGVAAGNNDISMDPLFVDAVGLDFHLETTSPLLNLIQPDAGDTVVDDLDGNARPSGIGREMGCFEIADTSVLWVHNVASGTGYNRLVLPDINADGHDELLLYEDYEKVRVISGADGITQLWAYVLSADPSRYRRGLALVNDLDGDAIKDIVVIAGTSGNDYGQNYGDDDVYAVSGAVTPPGSRVLWGGNPLNLGYGASSPVILSDIDGDGYDDIFLNTITPETSPVLRADYGFLISGKDGSVLWNYTYNRVASPFPSESAIWDVYGKNTVPDLDGDSRDDIVVSGAGGYYGIEAWKGGAAAVNIWRSLPGEWIRAPSSVGDVTGDGIPDIAAAKFNDADLRLYVLDGASGIEVWNFPFDNTATTIQDIGDINGSGYADIAMGSAFISGFGGTDYKVYVLEGNPSAGTRVVWSYDTGENTYVKVIPDIDGDGIKDVAVTGQMDRLLLLSGVDGSVLAWESFPSDSGPVQPGEFNNVAGGDILTSSGNSVYALSFSGVSRNDPPAKPDLLSPADEAVFSDSTSIKLESSAFSDPEGDAQTGLTWTLVRADSEEPVGSFPVTFTQGPFPTEHQITDQLSDGLKYTWQVGHTDDQGREVWSEERSFKIGISVPESLPAVASGSTLVDFGMISVVHWPDNPDPQAVFNINYDPKNYRIGAWDPEQNRYIEFGHELEIEPGRAVWILTRDPLEVNFNGVPVSMTENMEVCLHTHPSTGMGWNMIAPPNKANYRWNEVLVGRITDGDNPIIVDPVPVTSPVASTLINHRIWEWRNGRYVDHRLDEDFVLAYYKGYWVKAIVDGAYLVFPVSARVAGLSTPGNTMLAWAGKAVQWMKSLLPAPREAIADNDLPPAPMDSFDGDANPLFEGCFVQTLR